MIESLTNAQKALLPVYAETWKRIALEPKNVDRPKAEKLLNEAYVKAGLKPPKRIIWFTSNEEMYSYMASIQRNTRHQALQSLYYASVYASVYDSVMDSVSAPVWASVSAPVWASVRASVSASVWASVWASVCFYADLAVFDYFRNVCNITKETEPILGFITFAQECGCFYAMNNFALLCDNATKP